MAPERKSDYTGDRFGDWVVTARAKAAGDKKRRWHVTNTQNDETMVVLQTDLQGLAKFTGEDPGLPHPFNLPVGELERLQAMESAVGAGQCKHAVFLNDCPECSARMGAPLVSYTPQGSNALSAQISRSAMGVLSDQLMFSEAEASVELSRDPDLQTYSIATHEPDAFAETRRPVTIGTAESIGELGDMVREANAVRDRDPIRVALMTAMGALSEARDAIDQALKAAVEAGR